MKEILIRPERCTACRSCEIACAVEHSESKDLFKALSEMPQRRLYVEYVPEYELAIPITCRHCEDAPCVAVCPTGALTQDPVSGVVKHNKNLCIGCWTCASVCTYGVIGRDRRARVAMKCDRCPDREIPACVNACPTKALVYAEVGELSESRRITSALKLARGVVAGSTR